MLLRAALCHHKDEICTSKYMWIGQRSTLHNKSKRKTGHRTINSSASMPDLPPPARPPNHFPQPLATVKINSATQKVGPASTMRTSMSPYLGFTTHGMCLCSHKRQGTGSIRMMMPHAAYLRGLLLRAALGHRKDEVCTKRDTAARYVRMRRLGWHVLCAKACAGNLQVTCRLRPVRVRLVDAASPREGEPVANTIPTRHTKARVSMHV